MLVRNSPRQALFILLIATLTLGACNVGSTPAPTADVNAINTAALASAMAQISAQQTQTALAAPSATPLPTDTALPVTTLVLSTSAVASPTGGGTGALPTLSFNTTPNTTPLAGFTPIGSSAAPVATTSLGDSCHNSSFEGDVTIPDGSVIEPGADFQKVWALKNTGSCTWDEGFALVYIGGSNPNLDPYNFEFKRSSDFVAGGQSINMTLNLTAPCTPGKYEGHWRMRSDTGFFFGTILSVYIEVKNRC
jgi:hypothetical protein